jgi:hypothetical protein
MSTDNINFYYNSISGPTAMELSTANSATANSATANSTTTNSTTDEITPTVHSVQNTSTNDNQINMKIILAIFDKSNVIFLIWFLAIYLLLYLVLGIFYKTDNISDTKLMVSRIFDLIILSIVIISIIINYYSSSDNDKENVVETAANNYSQYVDYPQSIFSISLFIIVLYFLIFIIGVPMTYDTKPISISIIETFAWITLTIIIIVDFFKAVFNTSIVSTVSNQVANGWNNITIYTNQYTANSAANSAANGAANGDANSAILMGGNVNLSGNRVRSSDDYDDDINGNISGNISGNTTTRNEVFNVSNNLYTYDDAQAICKSYGSRLANYDDIEEAYEDGGEWCNYGWSEGQMIYFPTQKASWDKLQTDPKNKNNCGRPGINGGYIDNPYVKFGVNCFGKKPAPTQSDIDKIKANRDIIHPTSKEDQELNDKVNYLKQNAATMLNINSFNNTNWSEY